MIIFKYLNSGNVVDINDHSIKSNIQFTAFLNPKEGFYKEKIHRIEFGGKLILSLAGSSIGLWFTIAMLTQRTIMPCFFIFLTFQHLYLLSCQDLYFEKETIHFFRYFRNFFFEPFKRTSIFETN